MKKLIIAHALTLFLFSSLSFAEGGADRISERNETRAQEAFAAQQKTENDNNNSAKSDTKIGCEGNS